MSLAEDRALDRPAARLAVARMREHLASIGVWMGAALVAGCSSASAPRQTSPATDETGLTWLTGHWVGPDGRQTETWAKLDTVHVGVGFGVADGRTRSFEVMLVHETDAGTTYTAMPGGARMVDFAQRDAGPRRVEFENPEHDHPKQIVYRRDEDALRVELSGGGDPVAFEFRWATGEPAQALVDADIAFDGDTEERGGVAWAERFEPDGANMSYGGERTEGTEAITAMIDEMRGAGVHLRWSPSASGLSTAGDMGFTAGPYRVERDGETVARGVYVTIWRRDVDGTWKIPFDTGVSGH